MNIQRHKLWTELRRQDHLRSLAEYGRLLAQHRQQTSVCEALLSYLNEYDKFALSGQVVEVQSLNIQRGFAGQIDKVHRQQQEEVQQLGQHLEQLRQQVTQRKMQLEQLQQRLERYTLSESHSQELAAQVEVQEWISQRQSILNGH